LCWSVEVLERAGCAPIYVAAPPELVDFTRELLMRIENTRIVAGGDTRQSSVRRALESVRAARVVVHDAARPFVTVRLVHAVLAALNGSDAAITGVPVDETIKLVDEDRVIETVDRRGLFRAQTPQAFSTDVLLAAHQAAEESGFEATDDAQLVERLGTRVTMVPGGLTNIKVTYPEDFEVAERLAGGL
jgi:2-C-methyl-D-erythritol 4-phosphate cytidylyltransferase